ncbi:hypothetical protein P9272_31130 [Mesorhizobium sp. WSM4976]|uniref:hypothetical protein n=1 Tax=Mesorhizobium sp. WSM4976 TaxID=3038549 RepID=UPI0024178CF3|nr:hypothetical protein [Mesorhizobium sp. WSM4976]MDG4897996.1 hypothetical protein [Mesorhizobium sp. WSM4976]
MEIQRLRGFASNSMKIGGDGIKTSLTTGIEAFFPPRSFSAMREVKTLQPSVAAPLLFWRELD